MTWEFGGWPPPPPSGTGAIIGQPVIGGTPNAALFINAIAKLAQDPGFFDYDKAVHRLTLGGDRTQPFLRFKGDANAPAGLTFDFQQLSALFDVGQYDPVQWLGWNYDPIAGGRRNVNYGAIAMAFEGNYVDALSHIQAQEWHVYHVTKANVLQRPISFNGQADGAQAGFLTLGFSVDQLNFAGKANADVFASAGGTGAGFAGPTYWKQGAGAPAHDTRPGVAAGNNTQTLFVGANSSFLVSPSGGPGAGPDATLGQSVVEYDTRNPNRGMNFWLGTAAASPKNPLSLGPEFATLLPLLAIPAGGTTGKGLLWYDQAVANFGIFAGSGAPTLNAAKGSLYLRTDGTGVADRAFINTNGTNGWTAITTVA